MHSKAIIGDKIIATRKRSDFKVGRIYEVIDVYSSGTVRIRDDINDGHDIPLEYFKLVEKDFIRF